MSAFNKTDAHNKAIDIVIAALNAGVLHLQGPGNSDWAVKNAQSDASYINGLITSIAGNLTRE